MKKRVLIIGLDGATFDVINPLMEEGLMPNLAQLIQEGAAGTMRSTTPPISGPSWLALATGMSPERLGVYDFCCRKDSSYRLVTISSADFAGRCVWDYLGQAGRQVGILNYPVCIPPYSVNGFLSAGLGASVDGQYTCPAELEHELDRAAGGRYELLVNYHDERYNDTDLFLSDLRRVLEKKVKTAAYLMKAKPWDFFWVVFSETDWLQHLMWHHIDKNHPLHDTKQSERFIQQFKRVWAEIDEAVGALCGIAGPSAVKCILSDHGFGANDETFRLNVWLQEQGYLVWQQGSNRTLDGLKGATFRFVRTIGRATGLHKLAPGLYARGRAARRNLMPKIIDQIDLERSVAFDPGHTQPFGGIYVNDQIVGRDAAQRQKIIDELRQKLSAWARSTGVKIETWQKNSSAEGGDNLGPDLIVAVDDWRCVMLKDCSMAEVFERKPLSPRHTGSHRMNGIFIAAGPDIVHEALNGVSVLDVAPTILHLFGQKIPADMDGRVLEELFSRQYVAEHQIEVQQPREGSPTMGTHKQTRQMTSEEKETIERQLKDLGYM